MRSTRYSCQILIEPEFLDIFSKNVRISNAVKIGPVVPRVVAWGWGDRGTDVQTDMTKLIVAFCSVGEAATEAAGIL